MLMVIFWTGRSLLINSFVPIDKFLGKKEGRMVEWLALQTGKRGDSSSIPAEVKTFFWRNEAARTIH